MAKKRPSLKAASGAPALTIEDLIRMNDMVLAQGVGDKGPPAQQPATIPQQGSAGMLPYPIPQGGPQKGFMNLLPKRFN